MPLPRGVFQKRTGEYVVHYPDPKNPGQIRKLPLPGKSLAEAQAKADELWRDASRGLPRGVYEKVPGSEDYWIRYADPNSKIRRQHVGRSLSAAKELAEQMRTQVRLGKFNPDDVGRKRRHRMTVAEMFRHYRALRLDVRNRGEDARYGAYWSELFGDLELDELTTADLDKWRAKRRAEVKPATVNRALTYLGAYYALAVRDGHCQANPVNRIKPLRETSRTRFLTEEEQVRLAAQMDPRDYRLVRFAIATGLRQAEQFALRWEHVDLKAGNLKIPETKAGEHRFVPINSTTRALLAELREAVPESSPWVFASSRKPETHIDPKNFAKRVFRPALQRAEIRGFVWHDLRRTAGSRLAMAGVPLHTIAKILGQATVRVTAIYSHLSPTHLRDAMERLN